MKRLVSVLLFLALLSGCAQTVPPEVPAEEVMTEQAVLDAYAEAARVYDWFDLASLPVSEDTAAVDGQVYSAVSCEGIFTYSDLKRTVYDCFAEPLADSILADGSYRDIDGKLYTLGGARGQNLYLLDKTVSAEQVDEHHWAVTLTFWADFVDHVQTPIPDTDGTTLTPVATVGYSQTTVDYEKTVDGWRFTNFCSSDALDLDAVTVYTINYDQDFEVTDAYQNYDDWKLVCYLIHADGAYAEAPFDLLLHRFLERPEDILRVLALLDNSPYVEKYAHIDGIVAGPGYSAAGWLYREEQADFQQILDTFQPETAAEQAVLDKIRTAYQSASAGSEESPIEEEFSLIVPGEMQLLTLGPQEGTFPWGYSLEGTVTYTGSGDTYGTVYEMDCGNIQLAYSVSPDDGTAYLYKLSTAVHYDQSQGYLCTPRGLYCGYNEEHLLHIYPSAVKLETFHDSDYDTCYVYEPTDAGCKHIAFLLREGVVVKIEMENLMDSRLLPET